MNEQPLKVGDMLLIKYPSSRFNGKVGKVVRIRDDDGGPTEYVLDCDEFGIAVFDDTRHLELVESAPAEPSPVEHVLTHEWCSQIALARLTWTEGDNDSLPVLDLDDLAMTREQLVALRDMLTAALEVMT